MKILMFGFDAKERPQIDRALVRLGHQTFTVDKPESAAVLARVDEEKIEAVIADGRVPKFEWVELCQKLRADAGRPFVYILLHVGFRSDESHEAWAVELGADDFLADLTDEQELWRKLRVAARTIEFERQLRRFETPLAICTGCNRIRDEIDHWRDPDECVGARLQGQLTAVICPDCYGKRYGQEIRVAQTD